MLREKISPTTAFLTAAASIISLFALLTGCSIAPDSINEKIIPGASTPIGVKAYPANSVVAVNGKLKVVNRQLCNSSGQPIQIKGMSTHGLQWYGNFVTSGAVSTLVSDWKATVVRAAMYVDEGGYLSDKSITNKVIALANYAEANGIYCIIDWHMLNPGDPAAHTADAVAFFQSMATMFASKSHILFEICNEPNGVTWASSIKAYANTVCSAIRAKDPNVVIIVGTSEWSQRVDEPAADPLTYSNVLYTLHFYSGTHTQWLRDRANAALSTIGIFITEWGTSDASGDGGPYLTEATNWMLWADQNKISWCNWSLCDKAETSAALLAGASTNGSWPDTLISASGKFARDWMRKVASSTSSAAVSSIQSSVVSSVVSSSRSSAVSSLASSAASSASGGVKVQFYNGTLTATVNTISLKFKLFNTGTTAIVLTNVKMRYYYTIDGEKTQSFACDYSTAGSANVTGTFVKMSTAKTNADYYFECGFSSAAGSVAAGGSVEVQIRFYKSDWSNYTQTGDYSFNSTGTAYADWTKTPAYISGTLKWGVEP